MGMAPEITPVGCWTGLRAAQSRPGTTKPASARWCPAEGEGGRVSCSAGGGWQGVQWGHAALLRTEGWGRAVILAQMRVGQVRLQCLQRVLVGSTRDTLGGEREGLALEDGGGSG